MTSAGGGLGKRPPPATVFGPAPHSERAFCVSDAEGRRDPGVVGHVGGLLRARQRHPARAALGDALGRVRDRWRLDGASDHLVSEALYLSDPEGNGVELYRDRPRESWPRHDDGRVKIATEPLDLASLEADAAGEAAAPPGT